MNEHDFTDWRTSPWLDDNLDTFWSNDLNAPFDFTGTDPNLIDTVGLEDLNTAQLNAVPEFQNPEPHGNMSSPDLFPVFSPISPLTPQERPMEQKTHTLPRRRSKYVLRRSGNTTSPITIPNISGSPYQSGAQSLAIQRWQNSPPEDEAASLSAIRNALDKKANTMSPLNSRPPSREAFRKYRVPSSTTSLDSAASETSLRSANSGNSGTSQTRRRGRVTKSRSKAKAKAVGLTSDRIFKCTFCCDTFKHKYDWSRHEKSLHLNMEEWICTPHGGSVVLPLTGRVHCAYCSALDPTPEHLQQHNHSACLEGRSTPRVFRRKDHLVQHLRLVHGLETLPLIDDWKVESTPVKSRCGFCDLTMSSWEERTDHLAAHFRQGKTMADWTGDHGFEPAIMARLTNAFPPYLIAAQSTTLIPFSATDPAALDHTNQLLSRIELEASCANCPTHDDQVPEARAAFSNEALPTQQEIDTTVFADILSRHLSRFAREQMRLGIVPTDEMFQRESRRLLYYDEDDNWNQTVSEDDRPTI